MCSHGRQRVTGSYEVGRGEDNTQALKLHSVQGKKEAGAVQLPAKLMAPSKYCRYWIRYSCLGLAGLYGSLWLVRCAAAP